MIKGQDVVLLLRLIGATGPMPVRELAASVQSDPGGTHRGLRRLEEAGLYLPERSRVPRGQAEEFLIHGVKYAFPARWGGQARGLVTAWAAEPLAGTLATGNELPPVWPHPEGQDRGIELEPLHPKVPEIALADRSLWELLALVDALRVGDARARSLAEQELRTRLEA